MAAVTTTVVDIPSRGAITRILYLRPDAPAASLVDLPGDDGWFDIERRGHEHHDGNVQSRRA